jgi:hypothetical protein
MDVHFAWKEDNVSSATWLAGAGHKHATDAIFLLHFAAAWTTIVLKSPTFDLTSGDTT